MTHKPKVLVTGGAGFIGSHIVDELLKNGFEVTIIDNLHTGKLENIISHKSREDFQFVKGDILDFDLVEKVMKDIDAVFHEAAISSVALSAENPLLINDVNVTGTLNLLKACLNSDAKRFIYASSAAIYGETETLPISESMTPRPASPYAVSKLASEQYIKVFHEMYGLETISLRYFNVYGPKQANNQYSGVINIFINQLLNNKPITIFGDGSQTRDFVNVKDIVDANMLALRRKRAVGETFNIATGQAVTIKELLRKLQHILRNEDKPIYKDPRPGDIRHSYADISKARSVLGYEPKIRLVEGLSQLVEWGKKNLDFPLDQMNISKRKVKIYDKHL